MQPARATRPAPPVDETTDQRVFLYGVSWAQYEALLAMRGESAIPRVTYLDGVLELMSPSKLHEREKTMIARLLELWSLLAGKGLLGAGSWTIKREQVKRGAEPDECYFVHGEREDRPDVAIEVVKSSGGLDKLEIYRALEVPEVWIWEGEELQVFALQSGAYLRVEQSSLLPDAPLAQVAQFARRQDQEVALREFAAALGVPVPGRPGSSG